ncbi:MAG: hypothetical protein KDA90_16200 [Planctomycetaceae bacterium]|nr:hypothetical protein [Planctomycetaceae bacterium]
MPILRDWFSFAGTRPSLRQPLIEIVAREAGWQQSVLPSQKFSKTRRNGSHDTKLAIASPLELAHNP